MIQKMKIALTLSPLFALISCQSTPRITEAPAPTDRRLAQSQLGNATTSHPGFICGVNMGPVGGGITKVQLSRSQDGTYEVSHLIASRTGTNPKTTTLVKGLNCMFLISDPVVSRCSDPQQNLDPSKPSKYMKTMRSTVTQIEEWSPDGDPRTSYNMTLVAPTLDEKTLRQIDPAYKADQKTLNFSFMVDSKGLSACKALTQ